VCLGGAVSKREREWDESAGSCITTWYSEPDNIQNISTTYLEPSSIDYLMGQCSFGFPDSDTKLPLLHPDHSLFCLYTEIRTKIFSLKVIYRHTRTKYSESKNLEEFYTFCVNFFSRQLLFNEIFYVRRITVDVQNR